MPQRLWKVLGPIAFLFGVYLVYAFNTHQFDSWLKSYSSLLSVIKSDVERTQVLVEGASVSSTVNPAATELTTQRAVSVSTVQTNAAMVRVVDGDTLVVKYDGQENEEKIRLLGINTPEVVDPRKPVECFGKEASAHMHEIIDGKRIRLDEDPQADNIDKYGRLLRNVVLPDGTDVNAAMVRDGYAYAYLSFPLTASRKQELKKMENDAKMAHRGLWSITACNGQK